MYKNKINKNITSYSAICTYLKRVQMRIREHKGLNAVISIRFGIGLVNTSPNMAVVMSLRVDITTVK